MAAPGSFCEPDINLNNLTPSDILWSSKLLRGGARFQLALAGLLPAAQGGLFYRTYRRIVTFGIVAIVPLVWPLLIPVGAVAEQRGLPHLGFVFVCTAECMFVAFTLVYIIVQRYIESDGGLEFLATGVCNHIPVPVAWMDEDNAYGQTMSKRMSQIFGKSGLVPMGKSMKWYPFIMQFFVQNSLSTSVFTILSIILLTSTWFEELEEYRLFLVAWDAHLCMVIPHQAAVFSVTMFLPWLIATLHRSDLEHFMQSTSALIDAFSAKQLSNEDLIKCFKSLEGPVVLRFRKTSLFWSPVIVLQIGGLMCFVFGAAYLSLLSNQMELIDRAPFYLSIMLRCLVLFFFVALMINALSLSAQLALVTDVSRSMLKSLETLDVMCMSKVLWDDPHAYTTHLKQLDLNMQVLGKDFSMASVFHMICTMTASVFFVFLSSLL